MTYDHLGTHALSSLIIKSAFRGTKAGAKKSSLAYCAKFGHTQCIGKPITSPGTLSLRRQHFVSDISNQERKIEITKEEDCHTT